MVRLEKSLEKTFTNWLKKNKIKFKKKSIGELLDRWVFLPDGHLFIVELKRPDDGSLSKRQVIEIRELRKLGYDVEVHDDPQEAIKAVTDRVDSARLSKEGREVLSRKLLRSSLLRSRIREDKYHPSGFQDFEKD